MMYDGEPHMEEIAHAKAAVSIPVIANGGIFSVEDAARMMAYTGADGIMIARYGLENPFIFGELTGKPCGKPALTLLSEQMALAAQHYDETFTLRYIKKLASYMMKKRKGTKRYKERMYRSGSLGCCLQNLNISFQFLLGSLDELREVIGLIFANNPAC